MITPAKKRRWLAVLAASAVFAFALPASAQDDAVRELNKQLDYNGAYVPEEAKTRTLEQLLAEAKDLPKEWKEKPFGVDKKGKVNFATYKGYQRFHDVCHVCHGQDGLGSTIAPNLIEAFQREDDPITYEIFLETVMNGRTNPQDPAKIMLPLATNKNVVGNIEGIYAYLKARAAGLPRGRPPKQAKPKK